MAVRTLTFRRVLMWSLATLALGAAGTAAVVGVMLVRSSPVDTRGTLAFENPLHIPPLAPSRIVDGRRTFDLHVAAGTTAFRPGPETATWGIDGTYLSPTLRADRGDVVQVNVTNGLDQATTLHWHGMELPATADGGPHQMIEPGATWSPSWTIDQPAATLWFHPHPHGATADHVMRGIAGLFIVDDPEATALGLPSEYGVDDIPVIIQDRAFDDDNQFSMREPFLAGLGLLGDEILVNGTLDPHLELASRLVRLRVLNGSNARAYDLRFDDGRSFDLVASDGGLLPRAVEATSVMVTPGERVEIVVELAPGEQPILQSVEPDLGTGLWAGSRTNGSSDAFDVLQLRAAEDLVGDGERPGELVALDLPTEDEAVETRRFELGNSRIDGRRMAMDRIDHVVAADTTEVWEVENAHSAAHSFHVHLVQFAVLDVDGEPPPPHLAGWKDTVYVPPGSTIRIIARFGDHADATTPYMYHCHVLAHEDDGMMGQFLVVEPGTDVAPGDVEPVHDHGHGGGGGHSH